MSSPFSYEFKEETGEILRRRGNNLKIVTYRDFVKDHANQKNANDAKIKSLKLQIKNLESHNDRIIQSVDEYEPSDEELEHLQNDRNAAVSCARAFPDLFAELTEVLEEDDE